MKTVDVEGCTYYIDIRCPTCARANFVKGHDNGYHPANEILDCWYCNEKSWLGIDTSGNFSIEEATVVKGWGIP